ncbi:AAA family ATPase [Rhodoplanes sp. Z2-YC6860]|uniref:AAA family ATPase n=1 Tax=Rhodoplanes sp. Z2-YC6860 TaxID=674703 RepID=UPI00078DB9B4|nr:ATP-binding protein [Rhodoplanes sp. Z2-YC6860]AMN45043.1 AAA ATPase [Rhodoplanes sp. Z2-YC6860]
MTIAGYTRQAFEQKLPLLLTPTTPIRSPEFLLGRGRILEDIRRAFVQPGRHVFIHGDRGVGKTSLAQTAALEHHTAKSAPILLGCDNSSTFYSIMRSLSTRLRSGDPTATLFTRQAKGSAGWQGFVSAEFQKTIQHGAIPDFKSVDDAISVVGYLADQYADQPVVVIDEFERIHDPAERMLFADFIKQCGDQSVPLRLLFCGIGASLSDLLDAHHSCYRYLTAAPLERLALQPRLDIISKATQAFGLDVEMNTAYRIALISDGFPHYIHLITEKLLWQVFEDAEAVVTTMPWHYSEAVKKAVIDIEPHLKAIYEKASLKYKADYESVLWAVADDSQLKRRSTDIYNSYVRIMRNLGEEPLPRETFNQRMNSLKKVSHAGILKATRQGWYEFNEAVVRGYVRLRAEARGVQLGNDHPLDGRNPGTLGHMPETNIIRSRQ